MKINLSKDKVRDTESERGSSRTRMGSRVHGTRITLCDGVVKERQKVTGRCEAERRADIVVDEI